MIMDAGFGGGVQAPLRARVGALMAGAARIPWATWSGAALSGALLVGLTVWAVDLTLRDVREVPVIAATEGPMRVAPESPGGAEARHQGLALSEIASGGTTTPAPDTVTLAPPPDAMDAPSMAERDAALAVATALTGMTEKAEPEAQVIPAVAQADVEGEAGGGRTGTMSDAVEAALMAAVASESGVAASRRPMRRPANLHRAAARAAPAPAAPAVLPEGAKLVQLATMDSRAQAEAEWARLARRHPDFLADRAPVIQEARAGERTFWRLRASGFADGDAARRLCTALTATGTACIPVTHR